MSPRGKLLASSLLALIFLVWAMVPVCADDEDQAADSDTTAGFLQGGETPTVPDPSPTTDLTKAAIRVVVALSVVLALVIGLAYLLKRASQKLRQTGGGDISVLAQVPIGPSQFLSVVDIAGEIVVLGVTEHSVTAISEIEDPAMKAKLREDGSMRGRAPNFLQLAPTFKQMLTRAERGGAER